jgi:hypothetical protein
VKQRIYVHHAQSETIDPNAIEWDVSFYENNEPRTQTFQPRVTERYDLGTFAVTELEGDSATGGYVRIGTHRCRDLRSR